MENTQQRRPHNPRGCFTIRKGKMVCPRCPEPDCGRAELLEAETSVFHTDQLAAATRSINRILSEIPHDSDGRHPAFIQTKMGIMLVWVEHVEKLEPAGMGEVDITSASDNETLAKALKLKDHHLDSHDRK